MSVSHGSTSITELPPILKDRFQDYIINILDEEDLKTILPLCINKSYNVVDDESVIGYSIMVNEYSENPEIVRITRIC